MRDGDPRRRPFHPGPARPAAGQAPGVRPCPRGVPRRGLRLRAAPEPVEVLRRGLPPQGVEPQALGHLPRALPFLHAHARVARPRRAASRDGRRAEDPREHDRRHLRAGAPRAPHRAHLERGPQVAGGRPLQRAARHRLRRVAGVGAEEEPPALGDGRGAAGDHAHLRPQRRTGGAGVDREGGRAPRHARPRRAALGPGPGRGGGLGVRGALRPHHRLAAQGELRPPRPRAGPRDLHRGCARGRRVRHPAALLRAQPRAGARGRGARAPRAPAGRARGRPGDLRLLRGARPGRRARRALVRGVVRRRPRRRPRSSSSSPGPSSCATAPSR